MRDKRPAIDFDFIALVFVGACLFLAFRFHFADAKEVRTIHLSGQTIARVNVSLGKSTVLSFPTRPTKVILGSQGAYAVEYVDRDIAIAALHPKATSNLFVYLEDRRFAFDLVTVGNGGGDELVFVRDVVDKHVR